MLRGLVPCWDLLWLEHRTALTLPTPTGPFAVGRAFYDWVYDKTLDAQAPVPGTQRELLVWVWYPASAGQPRAVVDDYVPAPVRAPAEGTVFVAPGCRRCIARSTWFSLYGRVIARTPQNNPELVSGAELTKLLSAWSSDIAFVRDR